MVKKMDGGMHTQDFGASYTNYFDLLRADTPELLDEAYRLRYQVYCVEHAFENPAEHSDARERDVDDDRSVHALLVHRRTGTYAGTVRVILPSYHDPHRLLPIQQILASQPRGFAECFPRPTTAEISRFLVSKEFRRRRGEELHADVGSLGEAVAIPGERRVAPYITFGLMRGVLEICAEYGVTHICAVMEPALIRILRRFGLDFEGIGDLVNHHGLRQPCVARLKDLVERNRADETLLWQYAATALQSPDCAAIAV
jgi:N-acyl amino acid synthase of PEP-CTERM/exosortase system